MAWGINGGGARVQLTGEGAAVRFDSGRSSGGWPEVRHWQGKVPAGKSTRALK